MDKDKRRMFFDKADLISSSFIYQFLIRVYLWLFLPIYFAQLLTCQTSFKLPQILAAATNTVKHSDLV